MADPYGKLYFSWVQCSHPCIPDPTRISAISNWQLAKPASASPRPGPPESPVLAFWGGRLRGESQIGGQP
jgi:hypothetical protein